MNAILSTTTLWLVLMVVFIIMEAATFALTSIWFAFGALIALIVSFITGSLIVQVTVFMLSSVGLLYFTKPIVSKYLKVGRERTNVEGLIGQSGLVTQSISKHATGQVKVQGQIWTAISDQDIEEGRDVRVIEVQGVKIKVEEV